MNESKVYYWLSLTNMTPRTLNKMLEIYSAMELWENYDSLLSATKLGEKDSFKALKQFRNEDFINNSLYELKKQKIGVVTRAVGALPERLLQREVDPPVVLYYRGELSLMNTRCLAIVGTRNCSRYGQEVAEKFGRDLAPYFTVVSGLAMGIDGYAQRAALDAGGKTIGVLGSGLNCFTPACNRRLFEKICEKGLVVTEYPPNMFATKYSFPARNRIISGLSEGVLIVEAGEKSGALITADLANAQNREVYAVPGNLNCSRATGTNWLLSRGEARLVTGYKDILDDLKVEYKENNEKTDAPALDNSELKVYNLLQKGRMHADELCLKLNLKIFQLAPVLTSLEMKGVIRKIQASTYCLVD